MMWRCKCGMENSSCKVYCKCGMMDPKYVGLPTPKKKNCFIAKLRDSDLMPMISWVLILVGSIILIIAAHIFAFALSGWWLLIPGVIDIGLMGLIVYSWAGFMC